MATKILLSHLKETLKQYIEVYYKMFMSVSLPEIFSPKLTTVRHLGLIFNLINNVLVTSQQG